MSSSIRDRLVQVVAELDDVLSGDGLAGLTDGERVEVLAVAGGAFRRVESVVVEEVDGGDAVEFPHAAGAGR